MLARKRDCCDVTALFIIFKSRGCIWNAWCFSDIQVWEWQCLLQMARIISEAQAMEANPYGLLSCGLLVPYTNVYACICACVLQLGMYIVWQKEGISRVSMYGECWEAWEYDVKPKSLYYLLHSRRSINTYWMNKIYFCSF